MSGSPRWLGLVAGLGLAGLAVVLLWLVPRGSFEFAYVPFDLAWPLGLGRGFGVEELLAYGIGLGVLGPAVALVAWGLAPMMPRYTMSSQAWAAAALGASITSVLVAGVVLLMIDGRAMVPDEITYRVMAEQLTAGRWVDPVAPGMRLELFDVVTPTGVTGKYLFGEPVVQIVGVWVGYPGLLHLPVLAGTLFALWRAAFLHAGTRVAALAVVLVALSPMVMLSTPTGLSHSTTLLGVALAAWGEALCAKHRPWLGALLLGLGIGIAGVCRPQVAVPVGGVFFAFSAWHLLRARPAALLVLFGVPMMFGGMIAAYNWQVTGSPLALPWSLQQPSEHYGFGEVVAGQGYVHRPAASLQNLVTTAVRFNAWWIGWPLGLLLPVLWLRKRVSLRGLAPWVLGGLAEVVFLVGYFSPGIGDVGPVYYLECVLAAAALGAVTLADLLDRRPQHTLAAMLAWLALGTTTTVAWGGARLDRLLDENYAFIDQVLAQVQARPALLLVEYDCAENPRYGNMPTSSPVRIRDPAAPLVVLPRPSGGEVDALIDWYGDRACFYAHATAGAGEVEVLPCADAGPYLGRETGIVSHRCPRPVSTAERLGLRPPMD